MQLEQWIPLPLINFQKDIKKELHLIKDMALGKINIREVPD